jgi:hypothetical protein
VDASKTAAQKQEVLWNTYVSTYAIEMQLIIIFGSFDQNLDPDSKKKQFRIRNTAGNPDVIG